MEVWFGLSKEIDVLPVKGLRTGSPTSLCGNSTALSRQIARRPRLLDPKDHVRRGPRALFGTLTRRETDLTERLNRWEDQC